MKSPLVSVEEDDDEDEGRRTKDEGTKYKVLLRFVNDKKFYYLLLHTLSSICTLVLITKFNESTS